MRRPLSPDLVALGDHLHTAIERSLARRRARRTAFLNGVATIAVAVPLALSVAFADLGQAPKPSVGGGGARPALAWTPGFPLAVAHIPEKPIPVVEVRNVCLDANDCRVRIPFYLESPLGKV